MADERKEPFVPMVNEEDRTTGIMDRATADYLASTDPNPTQAALDEVFARTTRARLLRSRVDENRVYQFDVVRLDVSELASLADLRECLRIVEDPESFGHMMMIEGHRLELWAGEQQITSLALLSWVAIRWYSVWKHDAWLAHPRTFEDWLLRHGIPDAQQRREVDERHAAESRQQVERWEQTMPPALRPLWPEQLGGRDGGKTPDIATARTILATAVSDPVERVRALYGWYGSGAGPWSGYPSYESAAEQLLLEYPIEHLIIAIETEAATETEMLGAARLFGDWRFGNTPKHDRARCTERLRQRMILCVEQQGIADNISRFRRAFELPD